MATELIDYFRKCRVKVEIPENLNSHSFLQSFILLFPLSSPPLQGHFLPITPLKCLKISHFLHLDKINRLLSDFIYLDLSAALHRVGPLPPSWNMFFPGFRTPLLSVFSLISTATPQPSLLATQSLCWLPDFQEGGGGAQGLAMAICYIFTHSLEDLNLPHSFKYHVLTLKNLSPIQASPCELWPTDTRAYSFLHLICTNRILLSPHQVYYPACPIHLTTSVHDTGIMNLLMPKSGILPSFISLFIPSIYVMWLLTCLVLNLLSHCSLSLCPIQGSPPFLFSHFLPYFESIEYFLMILFYLLSWLITINLVSYLNGCLCIYSMNKSFPLAY